MTSPSPSPRLILAGACEAAARLLREASGWAGPVGVLGRTPGEARDAASAAPAAARPLASPEELRESGAVILAGLPAVEIAAFASSLRLHETGAVVILAGAALSSRAGEVLRSCGIPSRRLLGTGCLPGQLLLEREIAARAGVSRCQVAAPVAGRADGTFMPLRRYLRVAGVPAEAFGVEASAAAPGTAGDSGPWRRAALLLARSVIEDRRRILTCAAFHPARAGLPEGLYSLPSVIGAGGLEDLPGLSLSLEERTFLTGA